MSLQSISIIVDGIVQGVFFRQSTKAKAIELGITGEVQNKSNGTVHIIATGTKQQLDELAEWCQHGPERAVVTNVKSEELPLRQFGGFTIKR